MPRTNAQEIVQQLCDLGMTPATIAEATDWRASERTIYRYKTGDSEPKNAKLIEILEAILLEKTK
jgi:hypothetical protein